MKKLIITTLLCLAGILFINNYAQAQTINISPSTHSWLPANGFTAKESNDGVIAPINNFLKNLNGNCRPLVCSYSGSFLDTARSFINGKLKTRNTEWDIKVKTSVTENDSGKVLDLNLSYILKKGIEISGGVAVAFDFSDWSKDNYILVPAVLYGGNRFRILPIRYPPYIHNEKDRPIDMPVTVTNIPHLLQDGSHAKVEMNTGNVSTPMLSFFNPVEKRGLIILTEQGTRFGNNGLFVEEDAGPDSKSKRLSFVISAPGVREQRYMMCRRGESNDHGADWKAGDELTLRFKIYNFEAADLTEFYAKVFDVRKALSGKNSYACVTPYSAAADLILEHHNKHKWFENDKTAYYSNNPGDPLLYNFQIGWGSVPILSYPDLIAETPERLRRYCQTLDNLVFNTQARTGLFYAINRNGEVYGDPHGKMEERRTIAMTRRNMDIIYFCLQAFDLMKQRNHAELIKPEWETSLRKCADGLIKVWKDYGQFGQFIDAETGKMDVNGSTAGCVAGAALALASHYFHEPEYLKLAEVSTRMYYERDFLKGYAGGGAAEILQSPDSEAPWDMVESCMALYDFTGKPEWLERAKFATNMLSTWMVSYDYKFPKGSTMEKAGTHASGSIFASSQNNHSAPGYYILSGDFLLKLFRATGDSRYAEMYKDQSHNVVQYVGAPHNPLRKESGFVTERVQLSDWEGNNVGIVDTTDSNMAWETLAALTCLQNPGIYLHTDDNTFLVMDHVEASIINRSDLGVTIELTNPTSYDAIVSILAETRQQSRKPLPINAFTKWPKVDMKAGETRKVFVMPNGEIKQDK